MRQRRLPGPPPASSEPAGSGPLQKPGPWANTPDPSPRAPVPWTQDPPLSPAPEYRNFGPSGISVGDSRPHRSADVRLVGAGARAISLREKDLSADPIEREARSGSLMSDPPPSAPPGRPTLI